MIKALVVIALAFLPTVSTAQTSGTNGNMPFETRLMVGWQQQDNSHVAGIEIRLAPGWKTYWRAPGAGGIAPRFDWSGSSNLKAVSYVWPAPSVFETYGTRTLGYEGQLILPVIMQPKDQNKPIEARLDMHFGVCSDICVPAQAAFGNRITGKSEPNAVTISGVLNQRAATGDEAGLVNAKCRISPKSQDEFEFAARLEFRSPPAGAQILVVETGNEEIWVSETDTVIDGRIVRSAADLVNYGEGPLALARDRLRLTLISRRGGAIDIRGCAAG